MNKIILLLCTVLAVAKGDSKSTQRSIDFPANLKSSSDDYIKANQELYSEILKNFDKDVERFRHHYSGKVEIIDYEIDMVISSILEINERINPLEKLSDLSYQCVRQYRVTIPTEADTQANITRCALEVTTKIEVLLQKPNAVRNDFQVNYDKYLKEVNNCPKIANNTKCLTDKTFKMNAYARDIQKRFEYAMDEAECSAKANVKFALDCSNYVIRDTIFAVYKADYLINNCVEGKEECTPCYPSCTVLDLNVDYKNKTIYNPLYNKKVNDQCVMFQVKDNSVQ